MQDNLYSLFSCYDENSSSPHSENANDDSATSTPITSTLAYARVPTSPNQWSPTVVPVIGNNDSSLTAFSDTIYFRNTHAPFHQTTWDSTLHVPPPTRQSHYSIDTHLRPWLSTAEANNTRAYAPPTWSNVTSTQLNRSQVPSGATDPNNLARTWSYRANGYHAVRAPAQPPSLRETGPYQMPTRFYMPFHEVGAVYRSTSQVPTTSAAVSSWTAQSMLSQVPSLSRHRRYARRAHAHPDRVICDRCQKSMRPQSLKRHVREVHDRIKRHTKRGFAAEP